MSGGRENSLIVSEIFTEEQREEIRRLAEEIAQAKIPRQLRRERVSGEIPVGGDALIWDADRGRWSPLTNIRFKDTQLTNDQVKAFRAAPITLVPAPGANLALVFVRAWIVADATAGAWTATDDNLVIQYSGGTDATDGINDGDLLGASLNLMMIPEKAVSASIDNEALEIFNTGDNEWGGGNAANTMSFRVWYSIVPAVAFS